MPVEYDDEELEKDEATRAVIDDSDAELNAQAEAYLDALDEADAQYGSRGVDTQINYIVSNIDVTDEASRTLKRQLEAIAEGESPDDVEDEESDTLSEIEFGEIARGFESFTEEKVTRGELITIEDFERYADRTGYAVEKVFVSNPWMDSALTEDAIERVVQAEETVELEF